MSMHGYADDTQIYACFTPGVDELEVKAELENCIEEVRIWMRENKLKLNDGKTEFMILGTKSNLNNVITNGIKIGEETIAKSSPVRNIGEYFDDDMKMNTQVTKMCKSAWFNLHKISKIRKYLSNDQTKVVMHAYVTSRLDNNNALLAGVPKTLLRRLQLIQNCAARVIMSQKLKSGHVTPLLKQLHWLPIAARVDFKILLLTYKAINDQGAHYLADLIKIKEHARDTRSSRDTLLMDIPKYRLKTYGYRSFHHYSPALWNTLPLHIRASSTLSEFKRLLKTFLFQREYN